MASNTPQPGQGSVVLTRLDERFDPVVNGISRLDLWSLWLILDRLPIAASELGRFFGTFVPGSVDLWHVSDGGSRSEPLRLKLRAFGDYPSLVDDIVSRITLDVDGRSYFSDIARVASVGEPLAEFLGRSTATADCVVVVQPDAPPGPRVDWAAATFPLAALWIDRTRAMTSPSLGDALLIAFIQGVLALGVVPVLLSFDASMRPALVALGSRTELIDAASKLQATDVSTELDKRLSRGLSLQAIA